MANEYRWYAALLRLYPKQYQQRFGTSMEQTFRDLSREHQQTEKAYIGFVLWILIDTSVGIIREQVTTFFMENTTKRLSILAAIVALILMIPLVAMQFSAEVAWTLFDFVFMGVILFGAGLTYELVGRKMPNTTYRFAVGLAVITSLVLIWINGAVGIIGDGPVNMLYASVIATGFIGLALSRLKPRGLSYTMFAMAIVQFLIPLIALAIWQFDISWSPSVPGVFVLNGFFALMFALSGELFRKV